jgi:hypothetical protein
MTSVAATLIADMQSNEPTKTPNKTLHPTATSIQFVFRASISLRMS